MRYADLRRCFVLFASLCLLAVLPAGVADAQGNPDAQAPQADRFFTLPCHPLISLRSEDWKAGRGDPFQRELLRQALFLTAREHFSLTTRDPLLGESLPAGRAGDKMDYALQMQRQKAIYITLSRGGQKLDPIKVNAKSGKIEGYPILAASAEAFSRGACVDAMTRLGYVPKPTPKAQGQPLPDAITKRLFDMDLITQFYLARDLHELIRSKGHNAQRLAALSMVYSNLGQLTRYRIGYSNQAFHARGFLYAQRAAKLHADRPEGNWSLVYAWMMFDLPGYSRDQLKFAMGRNEALDKPVEKPKWLELNELYWHYNSLALMKFSKKPGKLAELAAVLAVAAAESTQVNGMYRAVIENCRDVNPDTLRGYDACFAAPLWWLKGTVYGIERCERFHQAIPRLLRENKRHVPESIIDLDLNPAPETGEQYTDIARIAWALEASKSNNLPVELSEAALGHQLEEMLAASAIDHYAELSVKPLGGGTDPDVWEPIIHSLSRHEYATLFEVFRYSQLSPTARLRVPFKNTHLGDFSFALGRRLYPLAPEPAEFKNIKGFGAYLKMYNQSVNNVAGLNIMTLGHKSPQNYQALSSWLHKAAPYAPLRAQSFIRHGKIQEKILQNRVERAKHMPGVLIAAAEWYEKKGRDKTGLNLRLKAALMLPDKTLVAETAQHALLMGRQDDWMQLMLMVRKASRHVPPYGSIELQITATLMEGQKWKEALRWAKLAYEKRPDDNEILHLAWCMHKNGETDEAIAFLLEDGSFYDTRAALRFSYQLGLKEHTKKFMKTMETEFLPDHERFNPRSAISQQVEFLIYQGEGKKALPMLNDAWRKFGVTNDAVRAFILAEQYDDNKTRDKMLKALAANPGRDYRSGISARMAKVILQTPDQLPTEKEIRPVINHHRRWSSDMYVALNFGWYLIAAGDVPRGQKLLVEVLHDKRVPVYAYERYMAALVLWQSGYDMDKHKWRFPEAHDWEKR